VTENMIRADPITSIRGIRRPVSKDQYVLCRFLIHAVTLYRNARDWRDSRRSRIQFSTVQRSEYLLLLVSRLCPLSHIPASCSDLRGTAQNSVLGISTNSNYLRLPGTGLSAALPLHLRAIETYEKARYRSRPEVAFPNADVSDAQT